ncbi:MAG: PKD domain-containing protein [Thermoplasmata archaeon]|nr:PKD domain-containing protein [Thermoplasmata archaeon]
MKKIIPLCIVVMFICSGLGAVAQPNEENKLEKVTLSFSQPTITNENEYVSISSDEANSFLMKQGKPMLPSYTETFTFPFGTKIKSVTVTPQNIQMQTISKDVLPTPQRVVVGQNAKTSGEGTKNYGTELYPSSWFEYSVGCGRYNGELSIIVDVQIYPIKYHPKEKIIEWAKEAYVVVEYEPSASTPQPVYRDNYQLVVIGPAEYSAQIAPLITHKIGRGITSKFVSLTEIYDGTYFPATGRDNQEKIKYFIKNAIESWTTGNILLVGGSSKVPVRETHVYVAGDPPDDEIFVSDLYYADIYNGTGGFSSWDSNTNNIFGEYNWQGQTDTVDLHPDVYLARLPTTSTSQVTACVNKIKTYENTPGYQQSWFPNLVVVGGDSFDDTTTKIDEGEYANQKVIDVMTGFAPNKLWVTNGKLTAVGAGVTNIKNAINTGCGFVDFNGHGNTNIWATHPHDNFAQWVPTPSTPGGIRNTDIQTLSNGNKLPIVTVEACSTAKFASDTNCFNWAFLYNSNGGAIGSFGCTGLGYSYIGTGVIQGLIGKIGLDTYKAYKVDQATTFGEMWSRALNRYITSGMDDTDYKTVEEWQAFGDPTLAIGEKSQPPAKPATPSGPASGEAGTEYTYTTSTTDPDGDKISYMFDWGDGTFSAWVGPINSGATGSAKKTWNSQGTFQVKVVAKDTHGILSVWSDPLSITMPLSYKMPFLHLLERLFEQFPHMFPVLRHLLGY